jgi:putative ABC transport system permease protein
MIGVALKGLAARKLRALLTAFAVVIGVAMVAGTFMLTDTLQKSFDGLFADSSAQTDAVVQGKEIVKDSTSGSGATIPESLLTKVRALPEVATASGSVNPEEANVADIYGRDGKKAARESVGSSIDPANARFSPLRLKSGDWPRGPTQVVIDAGTAAKQHYKVGDAVVISTLGRKHTYRVAGTVSFGSVDKLGFASITAWDVKTAQKLLHREGSFDSLAIAAKKSSSPAAVVRAVKPLLASDLEVKDGAAQAKEDSKNLNDGLAFIRYFLLGFGLIALLVGAFVIFNTMSITVAQRTREYATLRTLGASRKQVLRSVKLEGLMIGLLASVIGLILGIGIAKGMVALFSALGVELPKASTVIKPHTVVYSLLLGTTVTLIASIVPARRATRVPPIAAVREGSILPPSRLAGHSLKAGVVVTAASLAAISLGIFAGGVSAAAVALLLGGGVLLLFAGIALLAPRLVKPLAYVVGWPARSAGGVAGQLGGANAVRNPGRTASTAAALMIGLTLVTVVAVLGAGINSATKNAVSDQVNADYIVDGKQELPFRAAEGEQLERIAGVKAATHVRSDQALLRGKEGAISGIDPATIARFYRFTWSNGSSAQALTRLGTDGALVTKAYAKDNHLAVGGRMSVKTPAGLTRTLVVQGIYDPPKSKQLLGAVSMSRKGFDAAFKQPKNSLTLLDAPASSEAAIKAAANGFGDATFHTAASYPKDATKDLATFLAMLYVLLGFSVIVSLFGMVNTMVLSVFERTREIGMLRTIGMTRRQARRMIRHESVITALIGAALGLGLGVFLAALVTRAAGASSDMTLTIPWQTLVGFTVVAILAGIGAAIMPARRASRLNVLAALQYE